MTNFAFPTWSVLYIISAFLTTDRQRDLKCEVFLKSLNKYEPLLMTWEH